MSKSPKISVITVVKNSETTIARCIESVLNQRFRNFEYIIQDGKSTDSTIPIIQQYKDKRLYFFSEEDSGIYNAMNIAWKKARGEYILFLNSDDYFYSSDSLSILVKHIKKNQYEFVCGNALVDDGINQWVWEHRSFTKYDYLCGNPCNHQSLLVQRKIFEKLGGFSEKYQYASDVLFMFEMIQQKSVGLCIDDIISVYSFRGRSSIYHMEGIRELEEIMSFHLPDIPKEKISLIRRMFGELSYCDYNLLIYTVQKMYELDIPAPKKFLKDLGYILEFDKENRNILNLLNRFSFKEFLSIFITFFFYKVKRKFLRLLS